MSHRAAVELKARFLQRPGATLAVAESLTAGNLQALIASISGSSAYFLGGVTAYTLEQKVALLGVPRELAEKDACVSEAVARSLAQGVLERFGSTYSLATTGYAEPAPASGVRTPFFFWALAARVAGDGTEILSGRVELHGLEHDRVGAQKKAAQVCLDRLIQYLDTKA